MFSGLSKSSKSVGKIRLNGPNMQGKPMILRPFSASNAGRAHLVFKKDGFLTDTYFGINHTVDEGEFDKAKKIVNNREFPTALNNPAYNAKANETKEIQKDLNVQLPGTKVMWIPDTLYELFLMIHRRRYEATEALDLYIKKHPKKQNESLADYFVRIAHLFIKVHLDDLNKFTNQFIAYSKKKGINILLILESIKAQTQAHHKNKILLFRGGSSEADFYEKSSFDLGFKDHKADYCKQMAGIVNRDNLDHVKGQLQFTDGNTPVCRSFGTTLLANIYGRSGHCVHDYAHRHNTDDGDVYVLPLSKKDFVGNKGLFYVNKEYDKYYNFRAIGRDFHAREKAHIIHGNTKLSSGKFLDPFDRIITHKTEKDVCKGYAKAQKIILKNAIPLTPYTKEKLKIARNAYKEGSKLKNSSKSKNESEL
jgi:hypothetical protein